MPNQSGPGRNTSIKLLCYAWKEASRGKPAPLACLFVDPEGRGKNAQQGVYISAEYKFPRSRVGRGNSGNIPTRGNFHVYSMMGVIRPKFI